MSHELLSYFGRAMDCPLSTEARLLSFWWKQVIAAEMAPSNHQLNQSHPITSNNHSHQVSLAIK